MRIALYALAVVGIGAIAFVLGGVWSIRNDGYRWWPPARWLRRS